MSKLSERAIANMESVLEETCCQAEAIMNVESTARLKRLSQVLIRN